LEEEFVEAIDYVLLPERKLTHVKVQDEDVCLLKSGGKVYAFRDVCSHVGGRLSLGKVVAESHIVCPEHRAVFDVVDGCSLSFPKKGLRLFEVKVKQDKIFVNVKSYCEPVKEELPSRPLKW
jgi:3-phenylpropionate/trans-cinnamate dioxygenase ferredoxin component